MRLLFGGHTIAQAMALHLSSFPGEVMWDL
jgi:hypothetical protein